MPPTMAGRVVTFDRPAVLVAAKEKFVFTLLLHGVAPGLSGKPESKTDDHHHEEDHKQGGAALVVKLCCRFHYFLVKDEKEKLLTTYAVSNFSLG